ncbi:MAG: amidohydrolase family protein [Planctomycetes bacterium]|nr:amidohydrolase family protein [Planctomycetota bacterium]
MNHSHVTLGLLLALSISTAAVAQEIVAVKAGKVITMTGSDFDNAVILIEDGRISQVGPNIEIPWNAKVVDASDKTVMPTWVIAHCSGGMDGANERMENVPFLSVADGVDPSDSFFEEALRNGVGCMNVMPGNSTLLGGTGMVLRPTGATVEDMAMRDRSGLKLSLGSSDAGKVAQIRKLRRTLEDARDAEQELERKRAEFEREKAAGATDEKEFEEKHPEEKQAVVDLIHGKLRGYLYVGGTADVAEVGRMKKTWADLDLVLVAGPETYKAAHALAQLGLPVVLDWNALEFWETDPITEEESLVSPVKVFDAAGISLVLGISNNIGSPSRYPWWQIATAVRNGVDRQTAMRALTVEPAKLLGLGDDLGSIEPGKIANLQVLTGDPIQATTWVETVLLEGEVVYERADDLRLQHLFGGKGSGN